VINVDDNDINSDLYWRHCSDGG